MSKDIQQLLKKYREFLILFYVSLKQDCYDSALSLIPHISLLQKKIQSSENQILELKKDQSILVLVKKILLLQNHIEKLYFGKKKMILSKINHNFLIKIDFLIKKFLQDKGL